MSLLKFRSRLRTVKSLNSIFAALQVVTVVRTKKVREQYRGLERYLGPMRGVLRGQAAGDRGPAGPKVLVVITSNRGLCGNFNKAAVGAAEKFLKDHDAKLAVLGRTGIDLCGRRGLRPALTESAAVEKPVFRSAARLFDRIRALGGEVYVAYNSFKSTVIQEPKVVPLDDLGVGAGTNEFLLEPAELPAALKYHYLEIRFYYLVLESQMGELGARLMVLKGAVDSSDEMAHDLRLAINKARQANITRELLEIVSAAEAVSGGSEE
ncbi:MAG: F0F1 ATP synthase subunit gamma [Candidatus Saganbacteria bacterium]|nr:F0F1 ATP synthase subunit gamma [Candidatus Saganbacteria bacterium]